MADSTTTPARTRNPRGEGGRLRDEIVSAAVALLDETGDPGSVTLRSIARRVGIAAPSIYRHFPDQPAIMLAVVQLAFADLEAQLRAALAAADPDARSRLLAVCHGYLRFAEEHPQRYRVMFDGLWMPSLDDTSITEEDMASLGDGSLSLLAQALSGCVSAGQADCGDPRTDAVALWLGLHGLAHQRAVTVAFPWPPDVADRIIVSLAHLTEQ